MTDKPIINAAASDLAWSMLTASLDTLAQHDPPRLIKALGTVERHIQSTIFPKIIAHVSLAADRLTLGDDDNDRDEVNFECPWCGDRHTEIVVVDAGERWTGMDEPEEANILDKEIVFDYGDGADLHEVYFKCGTCSNPIGLPAGWTDRSN